MTDLAGKEYFAVKEAAAFCCVSESHFRKHAKEERLERGLLWGCVIYRRVDLVRLIEKTAAWAREAE